jgi:hypothetical protein
MWLSRSIVLLKVKKNAEVCLRIQIVRISRQNRGKFLYRKLGLLLIQKLVRSLFVELHLLRRRAISRLRCIRSYSTHA